MYYLHKIKEGDVDFVMHYIDDLVEYIGHLNNKEQGHSVSVEGNSGDKNKNYDSRNYKSNAEVQTEKVEDAIDEQIMEQKRISNQYDNQEDKAQNIEIAKNLKEKSDKDETKVKEEKEVKMEQNNKYNNETEVENNNFMNVAQSST